jgi:hypothetical protein
LGIRDGVTTIAELKNDILTMHGKLNMLQLQLRTALVGPSTGSTTHQDDRSSSSSTPSKCNGNNCTYIYTPARARYLLQR